MASWRGLRFECARAGIELERRARGTTSETDALTIPVRREQAEAGHANASRLEGLPKRPASQSCSETRPSRSGVFGFHPSAADSARVSVTYHGWSPGRQSAKEYATSVPVNSRIRQISSRRLIEFDGPPPRLNTRPRTRAILSSAAIQASAASETCSASRT